MPTNHPAPLGPDHYCASCGRPFTIPPDAPHKRFCSVSCRNRWHYDKRKERLANAIATRACRVTDSQQLDVPDLIDGLKAVGLNVLVFE